MDRTECPSDRGGYTFLPVDFQHDLIYKCIFIFNILIIGLKLIISIKLIINQFAYVHAARYFIVFLPLLVFTLIPTVYASAELSAWYSHIKALTIFFSAL